MPRRRSTEPPKEEVQSRNTRRSARLAAKDEETISPVKTPKKRVSQKLNGQAKSDDEPPHKVACVDGEDKKNDDDIADFDVVHANSVPDADSEQVKEAIAAQGDDGSLLVGFVQIDKDETPSADSAEVLEAASKGIPQSDDSKDNSTKLTNGAEATNDKKSQNKVVEETIIPESVRPLENLNTSKAEDCVTVTSQEKSELAKADVVSEHEIVSEPVDDCGDVKKSTS